jgi:hypothetical protein
MGGNMAEIGSRRYNDLMSLVNQIGGHLRDIQDKQGYSDKDFVWALEYIILNNKLGKQ